MATAVASSVVTDEVRAQFLKHITPVFNAYGKLAADCATKIPELIIDALAHHHHCYVKEFSGVDIIIDELATDTFGHNITLTVLWSPEDKMNGKSYSNSGPNAAKARDASLSCIAALAKYYYAKK